MIVTGAVKAHEMHVPLTPRATTARATIPRGGRDG
jgi:hypothetical protein